MATSLLRAYIKIGDKKCASNKKWAALKHGMIVSWQRISRDGNRGRQLSGPSPGSIDKVAYGIIEIPDTPDNEAALIEACKVNQSFSGNGNPDKNKWRARKGYVDTKKIAQKIGNASIEDDWKGLNVSVEPYYLADFDANSDIKKSKDNEFPDVAAVADVNATTSGTSLVGIAGAHFSSLSNACGDIGNLDGLNRFVVVTSLDETSTSTVTENLNSHKLEIIVDENYYHFANSKRGIIINHNFDGDLFSIQAEGPGSVDIGYFSIKSNFTPTAYRNAIGINNVETLLSADIHDNFIDGNDSLGHGIAIQDQKCSVNIRGNIVSNCTYGSNSTGIVVFATDNDDGIVENNVVYNCERGVNLGNGGHTARRNGMYDNTNNIVNYGSAYGYSNASSDEDADDSSWGDGSNNRINRTTSADFDSLDINSPAYFRPSLNSGLNDPTNTTYLSANDSDIAGRPWSVYGDWIGARARSLPATLPDGLRWKINRSRYAIPFVAPFEAFHGDTSRIPLVITESCLNDSVRSHLFTKTNSDGSDIIISTTDGTELHSF